MIDSTMSFPAPAKINLFLHILGRRKDGYHDIQTVFQFLDFCDILNFKLREDGQIFLTPELANTPNSENLIIKAAQLLQSESRCNLGVEIFLNKRLPIGG